MQDKNRQNASSVSTVERRSGSQGLRDRLKLIVKEFGSNSAFARHIGVAETTIRRWLNGSVEPKPHSLAGVAAAVNVSIDWLVEGKGVMRPKGAQALEPLRLAELQNAYATTSLMRVESDNMEPTLWPGDDIGVEPVGASPSQLQGGVYVVRMGGNEGIWRLQGAPDKRLWLLNDNPKYHQSNAAIDLSDAGDLEIVARVVWVRHKL
jgi:phage repressor protein C with HTH and peptisase S24 domain